MTFRILVSSSMAAWVLLPGLMFGHGNEPGMSTATIGGGKVTVEYTGPRLKGRDLMSMIQPGSYWRMGADRPTILTTEVDLRFGDKKVGKGKYTLLAHFLEAGKWSLVVAESAARGSWEPQGLVSEVPGTMSKLDAPVEVLNIALEGSGSKGKLILEWGTTRLTAEFSSE